MAVAGTKVLIVDDEDQLLDIATALLKGDIETIDRASNGTEALKLIEVNEYHAVVTDLHMPEMDGIALIQHAREVKPELPFMVLSAHGQRENILSALKLGALDFIDKPFDGPKLVAAVTTMVELGQRLIQHRDNSDLMEMAKIKYFRKQQELHQED